MSNYKIGLIIADGDEYRPLETYIKKIHFEELNILGRKGHRFSISGNEIISVCCGIGKVNAAAAAVKIIDLGCDVVFNIGLSGGISGVLKSDIVVPEKFIEHDFDLSALGYKLCEKPGQEYVYYPDFKLYSSIKKLFPFIKGGTAVSGDSFICNEVYRSKLKEELGATSCDMETAAIAYVCFASSVPFLSIRKISDDAGNDAINSYRNENILAESSLFDIFIKAVENFDMGDINV